jgi:putative ABC transport system permease protein
MPAGVLVEAPEAAEDQAANLSRAYRVNLTMLAAIALVTGGFWCSRRRRCRWCGGARSLRFCARLAWRRSLFGWLLAEGAAVGLAGGVVGAAVGHGLAWGALALLGGDLGAGYFQGCGRSWCSSPA